MSEENDLFNDMSDDDEWERDDPAEEDFEEDSPLTLRTVLLMKNDMLALLSIKTSPERGVIVRVDPRQPVPAAKEYEDVESALRWFNRSLATSKRNGWCVVYDGEPLFG